MRSGAVGVITVLVAAFSDIVAGWPVTCARWRFDGICRHVQKYSSEATDGNWERNAYWSGLSALRKRLRASIRLSVYVDSDDQLINP